MSEIRGPACLRERALLEHGLLAPTWERGKGALSGLFYKDIDLTREGFVLMT